MKLYELWRTDEWVVFNIEKGERIVGSIELIPSKDGNNLYIENISKNKNYNGKRLVEEVCHYLQRKYNCNISCLPLPQYRQYYESIGFERSKTQGEDIWYTLYINTKVS